MAKLSSTTTLPALFCNKYSTRFDPIKPAPPVTKKLKLLIKDQASTYNISSNEFIQKTLIELGDIEAINEGAIKTKKGGGINKTFFGKVIDLPPEILNERKLTLK
mgnify:CR=1 FL=1